MSICEGREKERIMASPLKDIHILTPRTCQYVSLLGSRDFTDVIKVEGLEIGDDPGLSRWVQSNHASL